MIGDHQSVISFHLSMLCSPLGHLNSVVTCEIYHSDEEQSIHDLAHIMEFLKYSPRAFQRAIIFWDIMFSYQWIDHKYGKWALSGHSAPTSPRMRKTQLVQDDCQFQIVFITIDLTRVGAHMSVLFRVKILELIK